MKKVEVALLMFLGVSILARGQTARQSARAARDDKATTVAAATDKATTQTRLRPDDLWKPTPRPKYPMPVNLKRYRDQPAPVYHSYPPPTHSGFILEKRESRDGTTYTAFPARARPVERDRHFDYRLYIPVDEYWPRPWDEAPPGPKIPYAPEPADKGKTARPEAR